ncbi:MAG: formylglycine-generating enzyme family protein [Planctomycetales bacterium]
MFHPIRTLLSIVALVSVSSTVPAREEQPERGTPVTRDLSGVEILVAPFDATVNRTVTQAETAAKSAQQGWADHLKRPVVEKNSIGMELVLLPPGKFLMGSTPQQIEQVLKADSFFQQEWGDREQPRHVVTLTRPLYVGKTEVTQGEWSAVMGTTPWKGNAYVREGANYPATLVSWDDAQAFCRKLSEKEEKKYRLLTEAEWEYACRAGTNTKCHFGDDADLLWDYAWFHENAWDIDEKFAHLVGQKRPNSFGLYDMLGNVSEWCQDRHDGKYYANSPAEDPPGPTDGSGRVVRVLRGGSWSGRSVVVRSATRSHTAPVYRYDFVGFRLSAVPSGQDE